MNHMRRPSGPAEPGRDAQPLNPPSSRMARHALFDMRAGLPVLLTGGDAAYLALAAETATPHGLAEFLAGASGAPQLALSPSRAGAIPGAGPSGAAGPEALDMGGAALSAELLLRLADPTRPQPAGSFARTAPASMAASALCLAKLGRLLPAVLLARSRPNVSDRTAVTEQDIDAYRRDASARLVRAAEAVLPMEEAADARLIAYRPEDGGMEHVAVLIGRPEQPGSLPLGAPLVRVHSECFTGDLLGSLRCDCGPQLHRAIRLMAQEGAGVLLYMAQEGRGIGLVNKLRAYALQDRGLDTLDANRALGWAADERNFTPAIVMLKDLGITRIRLLTNNPAKEAALGAAGITVAERVSHAIAANGVNDAYLDTKARRFGHLLG